MRFLFRAAFWLLVMSALIPARGSGSADARTSLGDTVGHGLAAAGEALSSWCSGEPGDCLVLARAGAGAMGRVAAGATTSVPAAAATPPAAAGAPVPLPAPRPATLSRS
jgi:hypothetical protein